jgi:hypothetical protein
LPQADIFQTLRLIRSKLPTTQLQYKWVKAHVDWTIPWAWMTLVQQLNTMCNKLANCTVIQACSNKGNEKECSWLLSMEGVAIIINGAKITSNVYTPTWFHLRREEARQFYTRPMRIKNGSNKGGLGWSAAAFNAIDWQAITAALKGKPDTFGLWLSKQAIGMCATRKNLVRIQDILDDRCPNCGSLHEDDKHLNRCTDHSRCRLFCKDVRQLKQWLYHNNQTDPELAFWIPYYLLIQGQTPMANLGPNISPAMRKAASSKDTIGWMEFLHWKESQKIVQLQLSYGTVTGSNLTPTQWAKRLVECLILISHSQWLF